MSKGCFVEVNVDLALFPFLGQSSLKFYVWSWARVHYWASTFLHNCIADSSRSGLVANFFWTKKIPACIISLGYFQRNLYTSCLMRRSTKGKLRSQELCTLNIVRIESSNRLSVPALSLLILSSFYSIWECSNSVLNNFSKNAIIFRRYFVICQLSPDQRSKGRGYESWNVNNTKFCYRVPRMYRFKIAIRKR